MISSYSKLPLAKLQQLLQELACFDVSLERRYQKGKRFLWGWLAVAMGLGVASVWLFPLGLAFLGLLVPLSIVYGAEYLSHINPTNIRSQNELEVLESIRHTLQHNPELRGFFEGVLHQMEQKMLPNQQLVKLRDGLRDIEHMKQLSEEDIPTVSKEIESVRKLLQDKDTTVDILEGPKTLIKVEACVSKHAR